MDTATRTVTIEVTEDHIRTYGRDSGLPFNCPIFHAARDAGLEVGGVWYDDMRLHGKGYPEGEVVAIPLPPEAEQWQRDAGEINQDDRPDRLEPITFTVEVPVRF